MVFRVHLSRSPQKPHKAPPGALWREKKEGEAFLSFTLLHAILAPSSHPYAPLLGT